MTRMIVTAVIALALGFGAGRLTIQSVSAASPHENTDQLAGVAVWNQVTGSTDATHGIGSAYEARQAHELCQTRLHLNPDIADLHDVQACTYRTLEWAIWWDKAVKGFAPSTR